MTEDHGVIVAALTPRGKKGDLDFGAAFELIDHLCAARVRGIALFTAAGEYPAFSLEERTRLLYLAVKRSRVPLYAGVGSIGLDDSLTLAQGGPPRGRRRRVPAAAAFLSLPAGRDPRILSPVCLPDGRRAFRPTWPIRRP